MLTQLGLVVTEAGSGTAALELLDREPIDVVLLDLEMPGLDGRATVREIRSPRRVARPPSSP